jgi:hypothetical protein
MFSRENGAALAWLLLFVLMVGGTIYDRTVRAPDRIVAFR